MQSCIYSIIKSLTFFSGSRPDCWVKNVLLKGPGQSSFQNVDRIFHNKNIYMQFKRIDLFVFWSRYCWLLRDMMALTTQMESKSLAKMTKYKMLTANWNHSCVIKTQSLQTQDNRWRRCGEAGDATVSNSRLELV